MPGWKCRRYSYDGEGDGDDNCNDDGTRSVPREEENRRIAFFMHANQLFIQYIENTRERGEKERERECGGGGGEGGRGGGRGGAGGKKGMQQQARVIDMKRVHSCLDVVILNGRGMDRRAGARLDCIVLCCVYCLYVYFILYISFYIFSFTYFLLFHVNAQKKLLF